MLRQLRKTNPAIKPAGAVIVDVIKQAHVPLHLKANLLGLIWGQNGPVGVLSVGKGIREVEYDPIWRSAVCSESPDILLDKWQRFEVFAHSQNRVKIDKKSKNAFLFKRHTVDGGVPTAPENLLICGLLIALLERIGCQRLQCQMNHVDGTPFVIRREGTFNVPDDINQLDTSNWIISWDDFLSNVEPKSYNLVEHIDKLLQTSTSTENPPLEQMMRPIIRDVSRIWKVEELAHEIGMSKRSFQRKLSEVRLSFSHLIRLARINEACRMLKESDATVTVVGFCSGFSDSAHFSRDFRASMGMTPTEYREFSQ